jgi:hypothetical protein
MNDSFPPIPPAPQQPGSRIPKGSAPPQYARQPYPVQSQQPYGAFTKEPRGSDPERPKSSGFRTAAGIVGIVCGAWLLVPSIAGFESGGGTAFVAFLILVAALGNVTAGIILLVNRRQRGQRAPLTSLGFAGLAIALGLVGMAVPYYNSPDLLVSVVALAAPVIIVMGIGLSRERRGSGALSFKDASLEACRRYYRAVAALLLSNSPVPASPRSQAVGGRYTGRGPTAPNEGVLNQNVVPATPSAAQQPYPQQYVPAGQRTPAGRDAVRSGFAQNHSHHEREGMSENVQPDTKRRGWIWLIVAGLAVTAIGLIVGSQKAGGLCGSVFNQKSLAAELYDTLQGAYGGVAECKANIAAAAVPTWILIVLGIILVLTGIIVRAIANSRLAVAPFVQAPTVASQIEDLSRLHAQGLITDEEFDTKRVELLGRF